MNYELLFQRLRDVREDKNLKQEDVAKMLKVSRPNYTRWETKAKIIPLTKLNDYCNLFNVSMDYVTGIAKKNIPLQHNKDLDKIQIGKRLKYFRKQNNITQIELAQVLNTNQSVISAYEAGRTLILTAFAIQICDKYKISMDWLCGRK